MQGTFSLADEDYDEPALELARARNEANLTADTIFTMGSVGTTHFVLIMRLTHNMPAWARLFCF